MTCFTRCGSGVSAGSSEGDSVPSPPVRAAARYSPRKLPESRSARARADSVASIGDFARTFAALVVSEQRPPRSPLPAAARGSGHRSCRSKPWLPQLPFFGGLATTLYASMAQRHRNRIRVRPRFQCFLVVAPKPRYPRCDSSSSRTPKSASNHSGGARTVISSSKLAGQQGWKPCWVGGKLSVNRATFTLTSCSQSSRLQLNRGHLQTSLYPLLWGNRVAGIA